MLSKQAHRYEHHRLSEIAAVKRCSDLGPEWDRIFGAGCFVKMMDEETDGHWDDLVDFARLLCLTDGKLIDAMEVLRSSVQREARLQELLNFFENRAVVDDEAPGTEPLSIGLLKSLTCRVKSFSSNRFSFI